MAITNGYATLQELKDSVNPAQDATFDTQDDANMELAIEAASRWIDEETRTHYFSDSQTRYYTPEYTDLLYIDDLISVTTLKTDDDWDGTYETTWTTSDYILEPKNARANSNDLRPYRQIRVNINGSYSFPVGVRDGVELIGAYGYAATAPRPIKAACLLIAHRLWKRHRTIFGIAGQVAQGVTIVQAQITRDADIVQLLKGVDVRRVPAYG